MDEREWVPDKALEALNMEQGMSEETPEELARRLLREGLPLAVSSLVHLSAHSTNERTRLDAAKSVIERNLGKPGDQAPGKDPLEKMFQEFNAQAN